MAVLVEEADDEEPFEDEEPEKAVRPRLSLSERLKRTPPAGVILTIAAVGGDAGAKAREMVEALIQEAEVGKTYTGKVKTTTAFGAFVEILPGVEGLVHISELQHGRTDKTEDVVKKGDVVTVKLLEVDERGRLRLSRKALIEKS